MATTDPLTGATINDQGDAATGGFQTGRVVTDLRKFVIPRFTTAALRDAGFTAAGVAPVVGTFCAVAGVLQEYSGTAWGPPLLNGIDLLRAGTVAIADNAINGQGFAAGDVVRDRGGYYTGGGATIATIPSGATGKYVLSVGGSVDGGAAAARFLLAVDVGGAEALRANGWGEDVAHATRELQIAAGATVAVRALQARGAGRSITSLYLSLHLIGS